MRFRSNCHTACLVLLAALAGMLCGCQASAKRYALRGRVVATSPATQQLTITHEEIPAFMAAMTMPYVVKDAQGLGDVQTGDMITADVVVHNSQDYWLEHLVITDKSGRGTVSATTPHELLPGEAVPDIPLTNQDGKTVHLRQFKGEGRAGHVYLYPLSIAHLLPVDQQRIRGHSQGPGENAGGLSQNSSGKHQPGPFLRHATRVAKIRTGLSPG